MGHDMDKYFHSSRSSDPNYRKQYHYIGGWGCSLTCSEGCKIKNIAS